MTQTKGRTLRETEAPPLKVCMTGFIAHSKPFTLKVNLLRSPYLGLFMFDFILVNSKIHNKSKSLILTI